MFWRQTDRSSLWQVSKCNRRIGKERSLSDPKFRVQGKMSSRDGEKGTQRKKRCISSFSSGPHIVDLWLALRLLRLGGV